jgi:hypothetical protein
VYDGPGLATLLPALLGAANDEWLPAPARDAGTIVLLVLDGLGWDAVEEHRALLPTLAGLEGGPITTVAPSTTASALTSLTTGTTPAEHGLVGFRIRVDGRVLNALTWRSDGRRPPDPVAVQRQAPFRNREIPVVTKAEFRGSGFTEAHLRGGRFVGWRTVSQLVEHCRRLAGGRDRLVYAYYPGVDEVAHQHGLRDSFLTAELAFVDRLVGDLLDALPSDCVLLVTADHGQVHVGPEGWVPLGPFGDLLDACSGDGRFRYLHARRGAGADVLAAATEEHRASAWVLSREQLIEEGWLGSTPGETVRRRLGDVVIAPFAPLALIDPALPQETKLVSAHGSLTPAEMQVPLLAGTAP